MQAVITLKEPVLVEKTGFTNTLKFDHAIIDESSHGCVECYNEGDAKHRNFIPLTNVLGVVWEKGKDNFTAGEISELYNEAHKGRIEVSTK